MHLGCFFPLRGIVISYCQLQAVEWIEKKIDHHLGLTNQKSYPNGTPPGQPVPKRSAAIHIHCACLDPGGILVLSAHITGREIQRKQDKYGLLLLYQFCGRQDCGKYPETLKGLNVHVPHSFSSSPSPCLPHHGSRLLRPATSPARSCGHQGH